MWTEGPVQPLNRLYWAFRPHFGRYTFQLLQNSVGSGNVLKIQRKNPPLVLRANKITTTHVTKAHNNGEEGSEERRGGRWHQFCEAFICFGLSKATSVPHVPVFLTPGH